MAENGDRRRTNDPLFAGLISPPLLAKRWISGRRIGETFDTQNCSCCMWMNFREWQQSILDPFEPAVTKTVGSSIERRNGCEDWGRKVERKPLSGSD